MQGKKEKPKIRFSRRSDGSIGLPGSSDIKTDSIEELWGPQKASPQTTNKQQNSPQKISSPKSSPKAKAATNNVRTPKQPRSFTIPVPKLKTPRVKSQSFRHRKVLFAGLGIVMVGVFALVIVNVTDNSSSDKVANGEVKGAIQTEVVPSFAVLTPNGGGVDGLGGFALISPEGSPPVYAYADAISGIPIKVSQQELPDSFLSEPTVKIKELAAQFNAKEPLEIGDFTAYIGASVNGAQSVVYTKGTNLVFIASENTISSTEWIDYIGNLRY